MMKQIAVYASALLIVLTPLLIIPGCGKSSDDDLIGNWLISYDFGGTTRSEAVTFTIDDKVYIATGQGKKYVTNDIYRFDLTNKFWTGLVSMPAAAGIRSMAVGFAVGGKGYVATGQDDDGNYLSDVWQFDPVGNSWAARDTFLGGARRDAIAFTIGDRAFVATGYNDNYLNDIYEYNYSSDKWEQRASMSGSKRCAATVFVYNNLAYVVSGNNNGYALNDVRVYNPTTNTWDDTKRKITSISDEDYDDDYTNIARYNAVTFIMNNKAYLATGTSGSLLSSVWEYDIAKDLWKEKTAFSGSAREGAIAYVLSGRGFVTTGASGTLPFENTYEFQPDAEDDDDDNQ